MRTLREIAIEISNDWSPPNYTAKPYLKAMLMMDTVENGFGLDSGESVLIYFLRHAGKWRGETARRVKAELKKMIK